MRYTDNEKYVKFGITGIAVIVAGLISYFFLDGLKGAAKVFTWITAILSPFVYGAIIAYIVIPLCNRLDSFFQTRIKGHWNRAIPAISISMSLLLVVIIVLAVLLLLIPQLIRSVTGLAETLPSQIENAWKRVMEWLETQPVLAEQWEKIAADIESRVIGWTQKELPSAATTVLVGAIGSVYDTLSIIKNFLLGLIVAIYLLARRKQLAAQARLLLTGLFRPSISGWIESEVRYMDRMFNGFFVGKLLDSAIIGILCFIGCLVMRFKSPALIAVVVGVTNIIPFFGPFIGAIPCALLLLLENPTHCLMFLVFILILQQLDGNVIGPRIIGNTTGLSGLWVMFAIILFGGLWGIRGMIVGVPLMAVIYDAVRQLAFYGIKKHGMGEMIDLYNAEFHPTAVNAKSQDQVSLH